MSFSESVATLIRQESNLRGRYSLSKIKEKLVIVGSLCFVGFLLIFMLETAKQPTPHTVPISFERPIVPQQLQQQQQQQQQPVDRKKEIQTKDGSPEEAGGKTDNNEVADSNIQTQTTVGESGAEIQDEVTSPQVSSLDLEPKNGTEVVDSAVNSTTVSSTITGTESESASPANPSEDSKIQSQTTTGESGAEVTPEASSLDLELKNGSEVVDSSVTSTVIMTTECSTASSTDSEVSSPVSTTEEAISETAPLVDVEIIHETAPLENLTVTGQPTELEQLQNNDTVTLTPQSTSEFPKTFSIGTILASNYEKSLAEKNSTSNVDTNTSSSVDPESSTIQAENSTTAPLVEIETTGEPSSTTQQLQTENAIPEAEEEDK